MRTKKNPEMPMVPKAQLKTVEHQRDQYKAERNTLIDDVKRLNALIDMKTSELNSKKLEVDYYENKIKKLSNRVKDLDLEDQLNHDYLKQCHKEVKQLEHNNNILIDDNERLMRRNQKLEDYVRMWEKLTKWKQGKLAERCNNDLLHELSYTMNELERDMYKERG